MLAVRFHSCGDPSVLRVDEVPEPGPPAGDELLVQVDASSVNGTDLGLRRGDAKIFTWGRLPIVPGFDLAGEVLACGPRVTAFRPGDRVMALLGHGGGGQAERVLLRQSRAALAPRSCSPAEAAALPLAGLTALQALHGRAGLSARPAGARVLVVGASGGIGSFGVQLAKLAGSHVTGTATGAKLAFVEGLGADELVDYRSDDLAASAERWDVILDSPGRYGFAQLRRLLNPGGVLVSTRPIGRDAVRSVVPPTLRPEGKRCTAVMTQARSQDLAQLAALVDSGRLRPSLDRTYPMTRAAAAHAHAESSAVGKTVLTGGWA